MLQTGPATPIGNQIRMQAIMSWWEFIIEPKHANAIMAIATVLIFVSGVCYTVFSALQWGANKQSADAATKSAEVAEQALVSVQRAFITQRRVEITPITDAQSKQITGVQIDLGWENNGTTPAKSLTQHISTRWDVNPIPSDFTFPDEWLPGVEHVPQPTYMGPKGSLGGRRDSSFQSLYSKSLGRETPRLLLGMGAL